VENAMRKYVMVLERKKGVIPQSGKEPDLALVKQAHCLFLKGVVQSKWKKPANGSGTTKIAFQMDRGGIKNPHLIASSSNKKNDEAALKSIVEMSDLEAVLPGFNDMTFDVSFDQQTGDITVS
jgi:hypothetical protein